RSLMEGHAYVVQEQLAEQLFGITDVAERTARYRGAYGVEVQGMHFVRQVQSTGGTAAVHAALGTATPTPQEFARRVAAGVRAEREANRRERGRASAGR